MKENFSDKVRRVVGIGAVAAGALTASSMNNNEPEKDKYTEPNKTEYTYTEPTNVSPAGFLFENAAKNAMSKYSNELKEAGYDLIEVKPANDNRTEGVQDYFIRLSSKEKESSFRVTSDTDTFKNRYSFDEFISEAVAQELGLKKHLE